MKHRGVRGIASLSQVKFPSRSFLSPEKLGELRKLLPHPEVEKMDEECDDYEEVSQM